MQIIETEQRYLLQTYHRYSLVVDSGHGSWVFDSNGNAYLDAMSGIGVNALGHAHPRITEVLTKQAANSIHTSNLVYHRYSGRAFVEDCSHARTAPHLLRQLRHRSGGSRTQAGALSHQAHECDCFLRMLPRSHVGLAFADRFEEHAAQVFRHTAGWGGAYSLSLCLPLRAGAHERNLRRRN